MTTKTQAEHVKIAQEDGIKDLKPLKAKHYFAKAVAAERRGDDVEAAAFLAKAEEAENEARCKVRGRKL